MWLKLDLDGINFQMKIRGYSLATKETSWDEQWCTVEYAFMGHGINYICDGDDILLVCEIEEIVSYLDDLLHDKIKEVYTIECIEPDFKFMLIPKTDMSNIRMELKPYFFNGYLTNNYLSLSFDRQNILCFRYYLLYVMKKLKEDDLIIQDMLKEGVLY